MRLSYPFLVFVTAMLVVIGAPLAYGQTSPASDGDATPIAGQPCPQWVHDQYVTTGPDGKMYPTWHPPVDLQFGCSFGHEHGADPRTSRANADLPAFGYAAAQMGMVEPHVGYKVFTMNAGDVVESNVPNKIANEDVRLVFHMGTAGVGRYTQQMHSIQYDEIDETATGRYVHVSGVANTGPTQQDGSTCDTPRQGAKDFSTQGCSDTYEIWNFVRFQILDPHDQYTGIDQSRFGTLPSVAVFDPITTRDPLDLTRLLFTQEVKNNPAGQQGVDPRSPEALYQGCRREFYAGPTYWHNSGGSSVYYTDALGHVSATGEADDDHAIRQEVGALTGQSNVVFKDRQDFCGNGIRFPN
jgi:hypothetical protein